MFALPMNDQEPSSAGFVPVYAVAAGLAAAIPMPFVDKWLARTARGSAMRRVASRHGLALSSDARRVLGEIGLPKDIRVRGYTVARSVLQRYLFPMIPVGRLEDALAALASATLFDSYLRRRPYPAGTVLDAKDAKRIRKSIDAAMVQGMADLAKSMPQVTRELASESWSVVRTRDAEGRARTEAIVDHLLDTIADIPESLLTTLEVRLEQELAVGSGT